LPFIVTIETKIRELQYKLLSNIVFCDNRFLELFSCFPSLFEANQRETRFQRRSLSDSLTFFDLCMLDSKQTV